MPPRAEGRRESSWEGSSAPRWLNCFLRGCDIWRDFFLAFSERGQKGQGGERGNHHERQNGVERKITFGRAGPRPQLMHPVADEPVRKIGYQPADGEEQTIDAV